MPLRKPSLKVSVIVPTYRRTADLARCLAALDAQERRADEVIVIARHDDYATLDWLRTREANRPDPRRWIVLVHKPGVVAAYNLGIDSASGDVLCFTDDDAAPHSDWITRIVRAFESDPALGGLGGRDIVHERNGILQGQKLRVGIVRWYGRTIGNHHIGHGAAREVQVLKGVNMAFRREAIGTLRFDARLRGTGAQVHCEMAFSLDVERRGWTLIYDPTLLVEHFPAQRSDEDQRFTFNDAAFYNASFNLRLIMCEYLTPPGRWAFVVYSTLIGDRADPGFLRALSLAFERGGVALALRKWRVGLRAMRGAWQEAAR
ncbi:MULTISPECIES: glycosyltransferase family 2 protein [Paraburkholderia]|jgi:glycosyltransferase involved in cell wall biosynthesis|uniref:Glycosyltransferase n=1 Tax=Paraburkholderia madseniana TaxID=2599607 RepID=A0A6N6WCH0_9BURK|nr:MULTISPECIES: glycosyltransferase [Paraburkholderia]KAE8758355.1 glycosyltransferase [Paraburkholderia madseniana]MCX4172169.1 glycosyltransferase [Paraburkholderia madseniana]MDQ6460178.1 glycosyltransferase [Paraburkholderia madseniana]NPT65591.1 glycosyltransferase [Paraburkholderia madseniana]